MRREIALLLGLALTLSPLTGCVRERRERTIRVGVTLYQQEDTFISALAQSLQQKALEEERIRGIKMNLSMMDGWGSQAVQTEQIDRFLDKGCDVICVNLVDRTAASTIIDKAHAAQVPIIFFNREPIREDLDRWDRAYYVGSHAAQAGELQGELVARAWRESSERMDRNGDGVLQYVMLEGEPGHQDALLRTEYSIKTLTEAGITVEKLANDAGDWQRGKASVLMTQWLQTYGDQIEVVFSNNDDMALGAIDACLEAGRSKEDLPFVVGVDATRPALEAVREGTLQGTVHNDADGQAESILSLICALAEGREPEKAVLLEGGTYVWLNHTVVTRENVDEIRSERRAAPILKALETGK